MLLLSKQTNYLRKDNDMIKKSIIFSKDDNFNIRFAFYLTNNSCNKLKHGIKQR